MASSFRRSDYMSGACTHREYYSQFVDERLKEKLLARMPEKRLRDSQCEHYNDIPLHLWDRISLIATSADTELNELGDFPTLAGRVCILKEAAKQIKEGKANAGTD